MLSPHASTVFPVSRFRCTETVNSTLDFLHSEIPTSVFGDRLKQQVSDRLKFYDSGELPAKNVDVMQLALQEADVEREEILAKERKRKKKEEKRRKKAEAKHSEGEEDQKNGATTLEEAVNKMEVA